MNIFWILKIIWKSFQHPVNIRLILSNIMPNLYSLLLSLDFQWIFSHYPVRALLVLCWWWIFIEHSMDILITQIYFHLNNDIQWTCIEYLKQIMVLQYICWIFVWCLKKYCHTGKNIFISRLSLNIQSISFANIASFMLIMNIHWTFDEYSNHSNIFWPQ